MPRRRFSREEICSFQLEVARGARPSEVARSHGFAVSNFRRWFLKHGRPHVPYEPTEADRARARLWRDGRTLADAWSIYRDFAREGPWADDAELPAFGDIPETSDPDDCLILQALPDAHVLVVCEKRAIEAMLSESLGPGRPSIAHVERCAVAWFPRLASKWTARVLGSHAKLLGAPLVFFGDLDPQALHAFAALRAGGRKALLRGGRHSVPVRWVGLDSRWLRWIGRGNAASAIPPWMTIRLTWLDQEYWQLVKRLVPDVRTLIGHRAYRMLDGGMKLEVDALRALPRSPFTGELTRRLHVSVR